MAEKFEVVTSFIKKSPLEKWFLYCRFGKEYLDKNAYKDAKAQYEAIDRITDVEKWKEIDQQKYDQLWHEAFHGDSAFKDA